METPCRGFRALTLREKQWPRELSICVWFNRGLAHSHVCTSPHASLQGSEERARPQRGQRTWWLETGPEVWLLGFPSPSWASPTVCQGVSDLLCLSFLVSNVG